MIAQIIIFFQYIGVVTYEDSPLLLALKLGHTLVLDEADKAPTEVT